MALKSGPAARPGIAALALLALPLACGERPELATAEVEEGPFRVTVVESGELRAVESQTVKAPRASGTLKIIYVAPEGSYVSRGDSVVRFDPIEAEHRLRNKAAEAAEAQASLEKAGAERAIALRALDLEVQDAEIELEKARREVAKRELLPRLDLEMAELRLERAEAALEVKRREAEDKRTAWRHTIQMLQADLLGARSEVERARAELESLNVVAPSDGLVVLEENRGTAEARKVQEGDTAFPGFEVLSLPDLSAMEIVVQISEIEAGLIREGQVCVVRLDSFPERAYGGRVRRVAALAKNTPGSFSRKTIEAVIELDETDAERMRPGMSSRLEILTSELAEAVFVPIEAVFTRGGHELVYVRRPGGSFREVKVVLGDRNLTHVVVESGLEPGARVALSDPVGRARTDRGEREQETAPTRPGAGFE